MEKFLLSTNWALFAGKSAAGYPLGKINFIKNTLKGT